MANARLLTSFTLTGSDDNDVRIRVNGVGETLTIPAGTYYWSLDDSASDFGDVLKTVLEGHGESTAGDWTVQICGVDRTDSSSADGRVYIINTAHDFGWRFQHAEWQLDPRVLGYAVAAVSQNSADNARTSPYVHRYGFYPQLDADRDDEQTKFDGDREYTSGRYPDTMDRGEYQTLPLKFGYVPSPLVRIAAAANSGAAPTAYGLTVGDTNCAWERFYLDLVRDDDKRFRYYADSTDEATYSGPWQFAASQSVNDPLAPPVRLLVEEGEIWTIEFLAMADPGGLD